MGKILIVDDEKGIRITLQEFLRADNNEVLTACNYDEAVDLLEKHEFELVVTDIILPGKSGMDLLKYINKQYQDLQVIIITGEPSIESASESVRIGAFDYLVKPVTGRAIRDAARRAFRIKFLTDEKTRLEIENKKYQERLEQFLVEQSGELKVFTQAVEQSPISIIITDADGNIEYVNTSFTKITGYKKNEVLGKNPRILKSNTHAEEFYRNLWTTITSGSAWQGEMKNRKKNGEYFWESATISPIRNRLGEISHFVGLKEEISYKKEMEKRLFDVRESEQRRIGRDLHDGVGQELTGIAFMTKSVLRKLEERGLKEADDVKSILEIVNQSISNIRVISRGLYPSQLDGVGLSSALLSYAESISELFKIKCTFKNSGKEILLDPSTSIHLYRITQEAVNNSIRHGKADQIMINLSRARNFVHLKISDNGTGISSDRITGKGMGLYTMESRVRIIGGMLDIGNHPDGGTLVAVSLRTDN